MNKKLISGLVVFIFIYFVVQMISGFYVDYEWFRIYGQLNTFWTLFLTKFNVQSIFTVVFILLFFMNFLLIRIIGGKGRIFTRNILDRLQIPVLGTPKRALLILLVVGVVVLGIFMGMGAASYWKEYLMFTNASPFTGFPHDPIFNLDLGFYIFKLPFYEFILSWLMISMFIITAFSFVFHVFNGGITLRAGRVDFSLFSRAHLSSLIAIIVIIHGIGYRVSAFQLLFSDRGKFFGAGYTDVNAQLIAYNVCMVISFIAAALLLFNIVKRSFKLPAIVLLTLIPAYFVLGTLYPSLQQRFIVEPDELDKERPYIQNNIHFTRLAYDIDRVEEKSFANNLTLTYKDIQRNRNTLENIRLWDWRPLKNTYKQLQELKPYYYFNDVDVDRYIIDGRKIAVNLSAREFSMQNLGRESTSWVNQHLIYTHGYGLVLSRVDRVTPQGQPEMLIYDIPPKSKISISVDRPELYYSEHKNPYVIVDTSVTPGEFDYPHGNENKYTRYKGKGGSKIGSFMKRLLFAVSFNNINILISNNITSESRVLFRRNITEMVRTMTPFLDFDHDPYLVIVKGKLYWILDGYTTTSNFPYSTPIMVGRSRSINYIRNSVKVIIDAYNGTIDYYIADNNDPILKTYARIFPGLFKDIATMPEGIRAHVRYPEDIFNIQSNMLLRYHMTNVNVFYNNEDAWAIPKHIYENSEEKVQSYYLVTKLPKEAQSEFILILPFTPIQRNNMVAFLTAKCDLQNYGKLTLYTLPKDKLSYGPMQIEAKINQDPEISKQLTLWSQKGSNVIRGNMLVIPIEESLMFIEPLYLKAETSEMPELRRVSVSFGDRLVMEENLDSALEKLFYDGIFINRKNDTPQDVRASLKDYAGRAYIYFIQAEKYQRQGNWSKYGEELKKLREVLTQMKNLQ